MVLRLPDSWTNWNLEMLVFEERGKPEYPEKNLSEQRRGPTTNSTHIITDNQVTLFLHNRHCHENYSITYMSNVVSDSVHLMEFIDSTLYFFCDSMIS